jgi:hypothetical protein
MGQIAFNGAAHSDWTKSSIKVKVILKKEFKIHTTKFESNFFHNRNVSKNFSLHNKNIFNEDKTQ